MSKLLVMGHAFFDGSEAVPVVQVRGKNQVPGSLQAISERADAVRPPLKVAGQVGPAVTRQPAGNGLYQGGVLALAFHLGQVVGPYLS